MTFANAKQIAAGSVSTFTRSDESRHPSLACLRPAPILPRAGAPQDEALHLPLTDTAAAGTRS
jgi:hypothetical protein